MNYVIYQIGTTGSYEFWNFEFWKLTKFGGWVYAQFFQQNEPEYAYKRYAYKKGMLHHENV